MALLPVGFAVPACCQARGALLPHHFTLATHSGEPFGGIFLLHFPSARAAQALPGTVPCGARTFLGTPEEVTRLSGRLRRGHSTASAMNTPESVRADADRESLRPIVSVAQGKRESGASGLRGAAMPWGWGASLGTTSSLYSGRGTSMCHLRPTPRAWRPREASRAQFRHTRTQRSRRGMDRHERSRDLEAPEDVAGRGGLREWPWMATPASRHRDVPSRRPQSPSGRHGSIRSQPHVRSCGYGAAAPDARPPPAAQSSEPAP